MFFRMYTSNFQDILTGPASYSQVSWREVYETLNLCYGSVVSEEFFVNHVLRLYYNICYTLKIDLYTWGVQKMTLNC